jgi:hypothetical protein
MDKEVIPSTNPKDLAKHTKKSAKVKRIVLDSVKDHLILHIAKKNTVKEIYDALLIVLECQLVP